jgi:serine/threonine-protein kinase
MLKVKAAEIPDPTKLVPGYPPSLAKILLRALARDRDTRYPTASALAHDLDAFAGAGGRLVTPATLLEIMSTLFPDERDRDEKWFEQPSKQLRTAPLAPLNLPAEELKTMLPSPDAPFPAVAIAPTVLAEPSAPSPPHGIPPGPFSLLTPAELAMFGALAMLALVAIVVAIVSLAR